MSGCGSAEDEGAGDSSTTTGGTTTPVTVQSPYPNAVDYTLSSEVEGLIHETPEHQEDVYKVTLAQSGTYTVYLELLQGTIDATNQIWTRTGAVIYDQFGNEITDISIPHTASDAAGKWVKGTFEVVTTDSTFYIRTFREIDKLAKYKLSIYPSIENGYVQDVEGEKNDVKAMATPITLAQTSTEINGSVNMTDLTDADDWYKLPISNTGTYTVYFNLLAGTYSTSSNFKSTSLIIYDEFGTVLMHIGSGFGSLDAAGEWDRQTFEANTAGNYYININRQENKAAKYNFTILPSVANGYVQDEEGEKNDVIAMATPITLAQASAEINGSINMTDITDTDDWYKLPISNTGTYTIYGELLSGTSGSDNFGFTVYNEAGIQLVELNTHFGALNNVGESVTNTFEAMTNSNYYIHVYRSSKSATRYKFSVTAP